MGGKSNITSPYLRVLLIKGVESSSLNNSFESLESYALIL